MTTYRTIHNFFSGAIGDDDLLHVVDVYDAPAAAKFEGTRHLLDQILLFLLFSTGKGVMDG